MTSRVIGLRKVGTGQQHGTLGTWNPFNCSGTDMRIDHPYGRERALIMRPVRFWEGADGKEKEPGETWTLKPYGRERERG